MNEADLLEIKNETSCRLEFEILISSLAPRADYEKNYLLTLFTNRNLRGEVNGG